MYADPLITDRLIQGTKFNKDKMIKTFRKFSPNGTASYENAITEVFKLFNKTDENFPSNHKCNRMIMIITDSAPGSYEHLFKEFNPQKNVRVFTYLLGQHSSAEEYVQELACLNRGYAVNIATLADVKENVLKYLDIIARSNALQDDAYFTWTGVTVRQFNLKNIPNRSFMNGFMQNMLMEPDPVRIDTMIASKEELPKMYTSVAKAVYDKTNKAKRLKEGNLLGVAGVDIPLQSFQDTLRGWKVNYRPVYKALLKSYYQNVDINEVEVMKDVKIDPLTIGCLVNDFSCFAPKYGDQQVNCDSYNNNSQIGATIIPYEFCQFNKDLASLYLNDRLCALRQVLLNLSMISKLKCDEEYLGRIYLDAKETRDLPAYWYKQSKSSSITKWKIQQAFSFHHSGLIRFYNFTVPAYPNFITDHIGGVEDSLYSATILTNRYLSEDNALVFHTPPNDLFRHFSSEKLDVPITLTTTIFHEPSKTPMGIVGLQITHTEIQNEFNRITNTCFTGKCHVCGDPGFDCYIINQAAMVLASNVGEKEVISHVVYLYDFQGICIETVQETPNFGNHLYPPFRIVWKMIIWFVNEIALFMFGFVEDLLSHRITFGQKTEDLLDKNHKETLPSYQNRENNLPPEDFMIRQNLMYYNMDEKNKKINNQYQDLTDDEYPYNPLLLNNAIHSRPLSIQRQEKQSIEDHNTLSKYHHENKSIINNSSLHNQSTDNMIIETILIPELKEESIDELYGKIDQDPYDTQLKALTAIELCRKEQTIQIQSILDLQSEINDINNHPNYNNTDEMINYTESTNTNSIHFNSGIGIGKGGKLIPGSLLSCVHRSVQQRCHTGAGTSSYTGRYACEAICEIVRERMPHLANRLEDCKQPLTSCTERFITYNVILQNSKTIQNDHSSLKPNYMKPSIGGILNENDLTGEYCNECGGR
ncbi:unnamed protein product [Schistosoma curassoni]|uniref:VWFA domain-containing protein n=1 Tax=Schistosoma curassoni TaxID=6186 RepID=A0A183JY32_9TREM|nr:unnamed protein product [Schistosoma curassoni]